jgi:sugar phosphate isomerase/epimerase
MAVPDLVASYYTLAGLRPFDGPFGTSPRDLRSRIEAAASAGYRGIGVDSFDLKASVDRYGHAAIKSMLAENGLRYFEIEGLGDWYANGAAREASDVARRDMFDAAQRIGVSQIKLTGNVFGRSVSASVMREEFARFCREAAEVGTNVVLEMVCISDIADLKTAVHVVGDTAAGNGGLLADIWHFMRGGVPLTELAALPPGLVRWVELDDGAACPVGSIISEQLDDRRLCGEGGFDIPGFLGAVRAAGYQGAVGVEILSNELRAMSLEEAARRSYRQAALQFAGG